MKLLKYLGVFLAVAFVGFVVVVNFSAVETFFKCSGKVSHQDNSQQAIIFMKLHEYRWWVGLWSNSAGDVTLEVQNKPLTAVYSQVTKNGDLFNFYDFDRTPIGYFSTLSKTLAITTRYWVFDGTCKKVDK